MFRFLGKGLTVPVVLLLMYTIAVAQPVADRAEYDEATNEIRIYFDTEVVTEEKSVVIDGILIDDDNGMQNADLALRGALVLNQSARSSSLIITPMFNGVVDRYLYVNDSGTEITADCWGRDYADLMALEIDLNHDDMRIYIPGGMVIDSDGIECSAGWISLDYMATAAGSEVMLTDVIYNASSNLLHFEFNSVMQFDQLPEDISGDHPDNGDWPGPGDGILSTVNPDEDRNGNEVLDMEQNIRLVNISFMDTLGGSFTFASALDMTREDSTHLSFELSRTNRAAFEQLDNNSITVSFGAFTFVDENYNPLVPVEESDAFVVTYIEDSVPLLVESAQYDLGLNELEVKFNLAVDPNVASYIIMPKFWFNGSGIESDTNEVTVSVFVSGGDATRSGSNGVTITMNVPDSRAVEDFYFGYDDVEYEIELLANAVISEQGNGNSHGSVDLVFVDESTSNKAPNVDSVSYDAFLNQLYVLFDVRLDQLVELTGFSIVIGDDEFSLTGGEFERTTGNKALIIDINRFDQNNFEMNGDRANATLKVAPFSVYQQNKLNGNRQIPDNNSDAQIDYIADTNPPLPKYLFYDFQEGRLILETQSALPVSAVDLNKLNFAGVTLSAADSAYFGADSIVRGDYNRIIFYLNDSNVEALNAISDGSKDAVEVDFSAGFLMNGDGIESPEMLNITDLEHLTADSNAVDVLIGYGRDFFVRGKEYFPSLPRREHASIRKISEHATWYIANSQWLEMDQLNGIDHYDGDTEPPTFAPFPTGVVPMVMAEVDSAVKYFEHSSPNNPDKGAYEVILELFADGQEDKIPEKVNILFADVYDDYGEDGRNDSKGAMWQPGYFRPDDLPGSDVEYSNGSELIVVDCYPQSFNNPDKIVYSWDNRSGPDYVYNQANFESINDGLGALTNIFTQYVTYKVDIYEQEWMRVGLAYLAEFIVGRGVELNDEDSLVIVDQPTFYGASEARGLAGGNILVAMGADHNSRVDYTHMYMFFLYLWEKYGGDEIIQEIAASPRAGLNAINEVIIDHQDQLPEYLKNKGISEVILDFATANLLDVVDATQGDHGIYEFEQINTRGPVRGSQLKWKDTSGKDKAPYLKNCPILGFSYYYTSYGDLDPNRALDPTNDDLVVFAGSDASFIKFRKVNVRASNISPDLGDEYKIQDFSGENWDDDLNRGIASMSPGGNWTLGTGDDDFPMWVLIASGGGEFTLTNESSASEFTRIFIAQNPALSRKLDVYVITELQLYNEEADAAPLLYASSDSDGNDTLLVYSSSDNFELTTVDNEMSHHHLYLASGWMPEAGTYYWHLGGYYSNGNEVNAPTMSVGVNRLPGGEPGELALGKDVIVRTSRHSLSRSAWGNITTIPDVGQAGELDELPVIPDDFERINVSPDYRVAPVNLELEDPATLTIRYDQELAENNQVGIYYLHENAWAYVGGSIDEEAGTISTRIARFGTYRVMAGEHGDILSNLLIPTEYSLKQNYPNPFNPATTIEFQLPSSGQVSLFIYDILGRRVAKLLDSHLRFGTHRIVWHGTSEEGSNLASGMYFVRLEAGDFTNTRKMVLVK
ncbi:MAG: T9SS type A sorting domain-containing protein [Candidatus Electryonea clarkiae]|nr:T9SS type A sorting domain-containing protein [Candidatus Electryonea clarkiae]MDP8286858.1 T9SS type A sorting domain-containing protein [Candidatus Electryonea clarkiae]